MVDWSVGCFRPQSVPAGMVVFVDPSARSSAFQMLLGRRSTKKKADDVCVYLQIYSTLYTCRTYVYMERTGKHVPSKLCMHTYTYLERYRCV